QAGVSFFIARQCLAESVLAVKNVADIDLQTGESRFCTDSSKDLSGALRCLQCAFIFAQKNEWLNRSAQRASGFHPVSCMFEQTRRPRMMKRCLRVSPLEPQGIPHGPRGVSPGFAISQSIGHANGCGGEAVGFAEISANHAA